SIDARDLESSPQAGVEMGLHDLPAKDLIRTDAAVIATLRCREAAVGEAERPHATEERVFLLDTKPGIEGRVAPRHVGVRAPHVRRVRLPAHEHHLAKDEQIVPAADRIRAREDRLEDAIRTVTRRLLCARSVEAPDGRLLALRHDLRLRTQLLRRLSAVDPDVLGPINAHVDFPSRVLGKRRLTDRLYRIPHAGDDREPNPPDSFFGRGGYIVMTCASRSSSTVGTASASSPAVRRTGRRPCCYRAWVQPRSRWHRRPAHSAPSATPRTSSSCLASASRRPSAKRTRVSRSLRISCCTSSASWVSSVPCFSDTRSAAG